MHLHKKRGVGGVNCLEWGMGLGSGELCSRGGVGGGGGVEVGT